MRRLLAGFVILHMTACRQDKPVVIAGVTLPPAIALDAAPVDHPVRRAGRRVSSDEARAEWEKTVEDGGEIELAKGDKSRTVRTCPDWKRAHAEGWEAPSELYVQWDTCWLVRCETLALLRSARASRGSFVADLVLDASFPRAAPAAMERTLLSSDDRESELKLADRRGKSWLDVNPKVRFDRVLEKGTQSQFIADEWAILVRLEGFGDLDGDGTEDVIVSVITSNKPVGSWISQSLLVLTRRRLGGRLELLNVEGPSITP